MKTLAPDEKVATVMVYTRNLFVRGEIVIQESLRASIWLRTQSVLNYLHLWKPNALLFGGSQPRSFSYSEMFIPTSDILAYHLAPPAQDPLDYDPDESNRAMQSVEILAGFFVLRGNIRVSTHSDLNTNLDASHSGWLSVYDADITNLYLTQFNMHVPMLMVHPSRVSFGVF
jgi:hypothetical protein